MRKGTPHHTTLPICQGRNCTRRVTRGSDYCPDCAARHAKVKPEPIVASKLSDTLKLQRSGGKAFPIRPRQTMEAGK